MSRREASLLETAHASQAWAQEGHRTRVLASRAQVQGIKGSREGLMTTSWNFKVTTSA